MAPTVRGIVIIESLTDHVLPEELTGCCRRSYRHLLGGQLPVTIAELIVPHEERMAAAMTLAEAMLPEHFYAHLVGDADMLVAFPKCVVSVRRDSPLSIARAQEIGALFAIPVAQMRFAEMFVRDHPDGLDEPEAGS